MFSFDLEFEFIKEELMCATTFKSTLNKGLIYISFHAKIYDM